MPEVFWTEIPDKIPNKTWIEDNMMRRQNDVFIVERNWDFFIKWLFNEIPYTWQKSLQTWEYKNVVTWEIVNVLWKLPSVSWWVSFVLYSEETWEIMARTKKDFLYVFDFNSNK